jgi:pimeloyl-ACP methyl ester carboxylesterase
MPRTVRQRHAGGVRTIYRSSEGRAAVHDWCASQFEAWPIPHQRTVVEAAGSTTHLVEAGDGPTVVVVAGDRFNAATTLPLLTVLAESFRVVAVDVPGQPGLSADWAGTGSALSWYGQWLDDVVTHIGPTMLLGHSFGGAICLAAQSLLVRGRLVVAPGGLCRLRLTAGVLADFTMWSVVPVAWTSRRLLRRLLAGPRPRPREDLVEWMSLVARHTRPISSSDIIRPEIETPVIVATGVNDLFLPPRRLAPAVHDALHESVIPVESAGHLVTEQQPEVLRELLHDLARQIQ